MIYMYHRRNDEENKDVEKEEEKNLKKKKVGTLSEVIKSRTGERKTFCIRIHICTFFPEKIIFTTPICVLIISS